MMGKKFTYLGCYLLNDRVFNRMGQGRDFWFFFCEFAEGASVLVVEIPVAALRFALGIEEDVSFGSKSAVVGLHQEVLLSLGPRLKLFPRDKKLGTGMALDGNSQFFRKRGERVQGVELVGVEEVDFFDSVLFDPTGKNLGVVGLIGGVVEVVIEGIEFTFF